MIYIVTNYDLAVGKYIVLSQVWHCCTRQDLGEAENAI